MPVLQPAGPASQLAATHPVTSTNDKPLPKSTAGATFQFPDSDLEADTTSLVHPVEEEGELTDPETCTPKEDSNQQISEEETTGKWSDQCVRSYMGWHQLPEFESAASSQDDNSFACPHATSKISVKLPSDDWLC